LKAPQGFHPGFFKKKQGYCFSKQEKTKKKQKIVDFGLF